MNEPECGKWKVWLGREIEGTTDLGEWTLFVREIPLGETFKSLWQKALIALPYANRGEIVGKRIWFCEEFFHQPIRWGFIYEALEAGFTKVCLCFVFPFHSPALDWFIRSSPFPKESVQTYLKLSSDLKFLKPGDHICIGDKFADESFCIGQGKKVTPADYRNDIRIA